MSLVTEEDTMTTTPDVPAVDAPGKVPILIDGTRYVAPRRELSGAQLRALTAPPISTDRDLWLDVDGGLDRVIADNETVELHPQMRFFTVPKVINPGNCA
jgi:Multiubiquitin